MGLFYKIVASSISVILASSELYAQSPGNIPKTVKISRIDISSSLSSYSFRVYMDRSEMCGPGTAGWSYMNATDPNFQAMSSLLMTAWVNQQDMTLVLVRDAESYCRIFYLHTGVD